MAATLSLAGVGAFGLYAYTSEKFFELLFKHAFDKEYARLDREAGRNVNNTYLNEEAARLANEYVENIKAKADTVATCTITLSALVLYKLGHSYFSKEEEQFGGRRRRKNQRGGVNDKQVIGVADFTNKDGTHHLFVFSPDGEIFLESKTTTLDTLLADDDLNGIPKTIKRLNKQQTNDVMRKMPTGMRTGTTPGERMLNIPRMSMPMGRMGMAYGGKRSKRRRSSKRRSKRSKRSKQTKRRRN